MPRTTDKVALVEAVASLEEVDTQCPRPEDISSLEVKHETPTRQVPAAAEGTPPSTDSTMRNINNPAGHMAEEASRKEAAIHTASRDPIDNRAVFTGLECVLADNRRFRHVKEQS
jgi:hypothetical protein